LTGCKNFVGKRKKFICEMYIRNDPEYAYIRVFYSVNVGMEQLCFVCLSVRLFVRRM